MSIQINLDGLSFCIFNPALGCIESIYNLAWQGKTSEAVQAEIKDFLHSEHELKQDFDTIKVLHNNDLFAFVPKVLFNTNSLEQYLKFNIKLHQNSIISHEQIPALESVNVYLPNVQVNKILQDTYGMFEYQHFTTELLMMLLPHSQKYKQVVYAHFDQKAFHLIIFQEQKMVLFNRFSYEDDMDMLYYLLFSLEQLEIDTEKIPVFLLGDIIRNSDKYRLMYHYIRFLYFLPPQKNNPFCQNMDISLARQNFVLTHSF